MEITILSENENPMLHRTDVTFRVSHVEATPDRLGVRDSLAARLNKSAEEVVIRKLDTKFGMRTTIGEAKVYEGPEFTRDVEQEYMLARNKIGDHQDDGDTAEAEPPEDEPPEDAQPEDEPPEDEPPEDAQPEDAEPPEDDDDDAAAEAEAVEE